MVSLLVAKSPVAPLIAPISSAIVINLSKSFSVQSLLELSTMYCLTKFTVDFVINPSPFSLPSTVLERVVSLSFNLSCLVFKLISFLFLLYTSVNP